MKTNLKILTSPWFIVGLLLLLLNDFLFKKLYGNWITGKLSDFAGMLIFPLFWTALFSKHKKEIFLLSALLFIYWKSPYSQFFITRWNDLGFLRIGRTVDYTDLFALLVLPIGYILESRTRYPPRIRLSPIIPLLISVFAFMATSKGGPQPEVSYFDYYSVNEPQEVVLKRLKDSGQEECIDSENEKLPPYKFCRVFIKNDTVEFIDMDVYEKGSTQCLVKLNTITYDEEILNEKNGDSLDTKKKEMLRKIFEREVLNKIVLNQR